MASFQIESWEKLLTLDLENWGGTPKFLIATQSPELEFRGEDAIQL